jgi:hypothetical protein
MVAVTVEATATVFTVAVALVLPAGTTTAAAEADVLSLENLMVAPPVGAGPESVTVAVELSPPVRLVGLRASDVTTGAVTVRPAVAELPE